MSALVKVSRLRYEYPDGTVALDDVSFQIEARERVGLVGPNGAGKSTLLWHLNGLLPERVGRPKQTSTPRAIANSGAGQGGAAKATNAAGQGRGVHVDGMEVGDDTAGEVRRRVGLVFQDPDDQLFCPTVREDVAFGPRNLGLDSDEVERRVDAALAAVELSDVEGRLPHHLSIGQRKRACLAGVLACRPQLLALDEPTANLDPRARRQLAKILDELDCALLVASHDLEMVLQLSDRVLLLDSGRLHADAPTREVLGDEALMLKHGLECPPSLAATR